MLKVTYIYHSGFLVELEQCYLLFDYYKGEIPPLDIDKPVFVFVSHFHEDHYNPCIFTMLQTMGMKSIYGLLSKDISNHRYPHDCEHLKLWKIYAGRQYDLPCGVKVWTLLSTDSGVAYLVQSAEGIIYHAGDLNDWIWDGEIEQKNRQMTGMYRHEIDGLKNIVENLSGKIDVAFVPLDPRLGNCYDRGLIYLLKKIQVQKVYPMHCWDNQHMGERFIGEHPEYKNQLVRKN